MHLSSVPEQRSFQMDTDIHAGSTRIVKALKQDWEESGWSLERLGDKLERDPAQLSRIFDGKGANPPPDLLAWAAANGPNRRTLAALNDVGGCVAPRPKPPAQAKHWYAATLEVLDEMGIGEVVRERARLKLPKYVEREDAP